MANTDTTKDTSVPIIRRIHSDPENIPVFKKYFSSFSPLAPAMTGIARKKENSLATYREQPRMTAPRIVAPLLEVQGIAANTWKQPMKKAV